MTNQTASTESGRSNRIFSAVVFAAVTMTSTGALAGYPFTSQHRLTSDVYFSPSSAQWVDLDKDGDLDVVAGNTGTGGPGLGGLYWFENRGKGEVFVRRSLYDAFRYPTAVITGDIDNDGDLDVVAVGATGLSNEAMVEGGVYWFENVANAKVWRPHRIDIGDDAPKGPAALMDDDGDGDLDIVVSGRKTFVYDNLLDSKAKTPLKFEERREIFSTGLGTMLAFDLDNDGAPDLIGANRDGGLHWWKNGNTFKKSTLIPKAAIHTLSPVDFDGDGDTDFLAAYYGGISVLVNDGGTWSETKIFTKDSSYLHAVACDLDKDGDQDVLVRGRRREVALGWLEHDGDAYAFTQIEKELDGVPRFLDVGDIDGDGDCDLLMDKKVGGGLSWFENRFKVKKKRKRK